MGGEYWARILKKVLGQYQYHPIPVSFEPYPAFKSKTGRVVQPITDAADTTGLGFATRPLTSSYNNYYYYVTLMVKLIVVIYR